MSAWPVGTGVGAGHDRREAGGSRTAAEATGARIAPEPRTVAAARCLAPATGLALAARACNAAEQVRVVDALGLDERADVSGTLTALEAWKLRRAARGLADGWPGDPALTGPRPAEALERALTAYRLWQRRSEPMSDGERALLAELHAAWLPTYTSALEGFDPDAPDADLGMQGPAAKRRLLAAACAPFCQMLNRELANAADAANAASGRALVGPAVAAAFAGHLIDRFELAVAWAVQTDQNIAFARLGIAADAATPDDHRRYFGRTFADAESHHAFHLRFPVLARWLATVTGMLCEGGARLIWRLVRDVEALGSELFDTGVVAFTSVELGRSDYHAGGGSVAIVDVLLASGPDSFVYKPRCIAAEQAVQQLLGQLADDAVIGFARRRVLVRDGYGYEERIPQGRNHVATRAQAARIYEELGGLLAVFHVLGGSDLHYENIMVADGHAFVCDCETALGVALPGQEAAPGTVLDSVYRTGLLDWPLPPTADVVRKLSGYTGGDAYELPFPVPRLREGPALAVEYQTGVRVGQGAANRIRLGTELLEPRDFEPAIIEGFCRVHDWFRRSPTAERSVSARFEGTRVRLVARNTQAYAQLLVGARHPRCLTEPLEVDLVFARLGEVRLPWDEHGLAAAAEARSLWQLDIPTFTVGATRTELVHDQAEPIGVDLDRTPLAGALERLARLSADDRRRQLGYIRASLSSAEVQSATFVATALEHAQVIGDELCRLLQDPTRPVRWTYRSSAAETRQIEGTLYYGGAGVALFLAHLDAIQPQDRFRHAARSALTHALASPPEGLGAFDGLAGQIYVLLHLHKLWGEPELLAGAIERSRKLDAMIPADRAFDVLSGSAGVIPVMLALQDACGVGHDTADRCASHLLRHAQQERVGLSWPLADRDHGEANLTGFAHGAAGIGWALIALGTASGREDYVHAGRQAYAYERLSFDDERQDWYDLRASVAQITRGRRHFANAWCNGAPGIGLSRLASWVALGRDDESLLRETYLALSSTLRHFAGAGNDTLCHGRCGNAELLLRFARERDEPAFQLEANLHAQAHWRRLASTPAWPRAEEGHQPLTGLMVGIAGVGMHFLRLACPDRVPSPLLLDPPAA
jgi:type 2 lantibiotic biosynthesis protein LanM